MKRIPQDSEASYINKITVKISYFAAKDLIGDELRYGQTLFFLKFLKSQKIVGLLKCLTFKHFSSTNL